MLLKQVFAMGMVISLFAGCQESVKELIEQTHPDGSKKKVSYYAGSRKNIIKTFFYFKDGTVQSEQYFKKGLPDSVLVIYYPNGKKYRETLFAMGKRNGDDRSWFESGRLKSEARYVNDIPEGKVVSYDSTGAIVSEAAYKNGKKEGEDIVYFPGGTKKKYLKMYVGGNASGVEKEWYENGNVKMEQTWEKNVLNGPYVTYYKNGKKEEEGSYKDGAYDGKRYMYNENGKKISEAVFQNGTLVEGRAL
ncbi:MAG: toxin-antitoxin system YwqK family antitoxin [Chitinispirillaceae bacterium]|jgi:antitoxin component YwqK of YwqJK toxin-antitoxin module